MILLSLWGYVRGRCVGPTASAKCGHRMPIHGDGWITHHVWSWVKRQVSGTVSFSRRLSQSLNPRQENVSWYRLTPHGRRKFCFRGWGTRNIKESRGTDTGRQNSDDVAKCTGNMKWIIALLHIWLFCRSLVSNSCIITTCSEWNVSIKWQSELEGLRQ